MNWQVAPTAFGESVYIEDADHDVVCTFDESAFSHDEDVLHASLMAAAPDLLAALEEALDCEFGVSNRTVRERAQAAIRKARRRV
jgi:hypothetical protein